MLFGRSAEKERIRAVLSGARTGGSGALVLRGESGIGKSALLDWASRAGAGMRVLRISGIEVEADLSFAGLLQLLWPLQEHVAALPEPQAQALRAVLGADRRCGEDRFLAGLALLTLLSELAAERPVLCLVDDVHWLDRATVETLTFVARRMSADRVAMLLAVRDDHPALPLDELRLSRLGPAEAARLLTARRLTTPALRERVIAESAGNPLALIEFAAAARRAGGTDGTPLPVTDQVLTTFRRRVESLPEQTRLMMLVAAAEARGVLPSLLGAARTLGVDLADLAPAERADLLRADGVAVAFRHPLIATAVYRSAPLGLRVTVHNALADAAQNPDCRAHHLAAAATVPDAAVAAELVQAAERAAAGTGYAGASGLLDRAAQLTPDPAERVRRWARAAEMALMAGDARRALVLCRRADAPTDTRLALLRATAEFDSGDGRRAARLLLDHGGEPAPELPPTAALYAWLSGHHPALRDAVARGRHHPHDNLFAEGLAAVAEDDFETGLPLLAKFVAGRRGERLDRVEALAAVHAGIVLGDDTAALERAHAEIDAHRRTGRIGPLPEMLHALAEAEILAGLHPAAEATVAEAVEIARDTGAEHHMPRLRRLLARIAADEGDEQRCHDLLGGAPDGVTPVVLHLVRGRHAEAVGAYQAAEPAGGFMEVLLAAPDAVEAAARLGHPAADGWRRRYQAWADAGGQAWAQGVALRCRALLSGAEDDYTAALGRHAQSGGHPCEWGRTELLYGEWLRRNGRRAAARRVLRSALHRFEQARAHGWARRTRTELRVCGDLRTATAPPAGHAALDSLTPQELRVVRLAARGATSRAIAAQLFLSPRTVEYHLYKAYPKLGVRSRGDLLRLDVDARLPEA